MEGFSHLNSESPNYFLFWTTKSDLVFACFLGDKEMMIILVLFRWRFVKSLTEVRQPLQLMNKG